ncbi:MAG: hypothetical protein L3I91_02710 [Mycoplasma sp.]
MKATYTKNTYSAKLSDNQVEILKDFMKVQGVEPIINDNVVVFKYENNTINLYKTKSVVIQGKNVVSICKQLDLPFVQYGQVKKLSESENKKQLDEYIGCDEVGIGDYFGGNVFVAVVMNEATRNKLVNFNISDSKKLTNEQNIKLGRQLMNVVEYASYVMSPQTYNKLYDQYQNEHIVKTFGHNQNIEKLQNKYLAANNKRIPIVMDQYCSPEKHLEYAKKITNNYVEETQKVDYFFTKAENKYLGVAVASIIARTLFLEQTNELEKELKQYGIKKIELGATNKKQILNDIKKIPENKIEQFIKVHFNREEKNTD